MLFSNHMPFQYFFFDTYPGYFLQILPIAVLTGIVYAVVKFRHDQETPLYRKISAVLFVCYLAGLICLVLAFDLIWNMWYRLLYHMEIHTERRLFGGVFNFIPDFFLHWKRKETIGNILAFFPFGILYPLAKSGRTWKQTVIAGFLCSLTIEILQPVVGRAFDINDIILNTLGVLISVSAFYAISELLKKRKFAS